MPTWLAMLHGFLSGKMLPLPKGIIAVVGFALLLAAAWTAVR